jgi:membrane-bound lytic murein transglycosylase D
VGRKAVVPPSNNAGELTAQQSGGEDVETVNQYYRVRKGDTLGKIAQSNGVRVSQLQAWNGLRNTRIGIGDRLIVHQKVVPKVKEEPVDNEYKRSEDVREGSNIISNYLKEQMEKVGQQEGGAESEAVVEVADSDQSQVVTTDGSIEKGSLTQ